MFLVDLFEAFNSTVPMQIVRAGEDLFTTRASINGRYITFNAVAIRADLSGVFWEIDFSEKAVNGPGMTFAKTGSGGEMQVFSFVIDSIKELIARYSPGAIEFASHKADGNRSKLYQRMISRIRIPGYKAAPVNTDPSSADDYFKIVRENRI